MAWIELTQFNGKILINMEQIVSIAKQMSGTFLQGPAGVSFTVQEEPNEILNRLAKAAEVKPSE